MKKFNFAKQYIVDKQYHVEIDVSCASNIKPFKEEVLDELSNLRNLHGDMPLLFSGGMDSTFVLRSLMELGVKPKLVTFSHTKDNSDYDCELTKKRCKQFGLEDPEFFYFDENEFFEYLTESVKVHKKVYPVIHGFVLDYLLHSYKDQKFFTGMNGEFKTVMGHIKLTPGPYWFVQQNPDRLFGYGSDRTLISFTKHQLFIDNYAKRWLGDNYVWYDEVLLKDQLYIRDLIYMDCYPDIELEIKHLDEPWKAHIIDRFRRNVVPYLKEYFPESFGIKPCFINSESLMKA